MDKAHLKSNQYKISNKQRVMSLKLLYCMKLRIPFAANLDFRSLFNYFSYQCVPKFIIDIPVLYL